MTINQRIRDIINDKKINKSILAGICNVTKSSIQGICADKQEKVGSHILEAIIRKYPDISAYWLLTGEGNMKDTSVTLIKGDVDNKINIEYEERISELKASLKDNRERVIELKERLEEQKERLEEQKEYNRTYQDTIIMYRKRLELYEKPVENLGKASSG